MEKMGYVYMWVNLTNGKRRVGHTINFNQRIYKHIQDSKKSNNHIFYNALVKYPIEEGNWIIESLEVPLSDMLPLERLWKVLYNTTDKKYGYDLMIDEEDRSGKNNPMWGKKRPDTAERNKKMSGENNPHWHKVGIWAGKKRPDLTGENNPMWGKKRPDLAERNRQRGK